jgi:hypothetical protein
VGAGTYAAGAVFFAVIVGSSALTAAFLLRPLGNIAGAPRLLAACMLFTFALIAAHLVPGALGILTRGTVALAAAAGAASAWLYTRRAGTAPTSEAAEPAAEDPTEAALPRVLAFAGAAAVAVCVVGFFRTEAVRATTADDMLNFHLPLLSRWIQSGSFWPVVELLPYDTTGNYPQNGDVLMLATVMPWRGDAFARLAMLPYLGLAGVATYALGRELRTGRRRAALMACVVVAIPILLLASVGAGLPDAAMYAAFGTGLVFLVRCARSGRMSDALLGGLALGIAFGTKWYAVPAVAAVIAVFAVALLARGDRRGAVRRVVAVAGMTALAGGFWLVRNAVESGSPFFPGGWVPIGARQDLGHPGPRTDFPLSHYLFDAGVLRHVVLPDELHAFGFGGILLALGLILAAVLAYRRSVSGDVSAKAVCWIVAAAALLFAVYLFTPNTATGYEGHPVAVFYNARYLVPAVIPAAAALAWAAARIGRWGYVVDLLAALAIADGLRRAFQLSAGRLAVGVIVVALLALAAWWLSRARPSPRGRRPAVGAAAAIALIALVGGYALQHRYYQHRLVGEDATVDYFIAHAHDGDRVGITGQWSVDPPSPVQPMFGPRLRNHVDYVGDFSGGVNKPHRAEPAFAADVVRGRYDWLIVGRGAPPAASTPEMSWATRTGYTMVAATRRLALYRRAAGP